MKSSSEGRVFGLDILRAFAILFVIYSHSFFLIVDHINERAYSFFSLDGVTLFFVLSGFLIGGILLRIINEKEFNSSDLLNFWIRRWFRTLPNYFFILLLLLGLSILLKRELSTELPSYFLFLQNFISPHPSFFPEAWSLSVEEWFYLLVPLCLFLLVRFTGIPRKNLVLIIIFALVVLVTIFRAYRVNQLGINDFDSWDNYIRKTVLCRLDSIMFGFLGAWISFYHPEKWTKNKLAVFIPGLILIFIPQIVSYLYGYTPIFNNYLSLSVTAIGTFLMLPLLSNYRSAKGIIARFIRFVSIHSYAMYLVNFSLVQLIIIPSLTTTILLFTSSHLTLSIIRYILYWLLTFLLSMLLYRYFEKPMMGLRERFRSR